VDVSLTFFNSFMIAVGCPTGPDLPSENRLVADFGGAAYIAFDAMLNVRCQTGLRLKDGESEDMPLVQAKCLKEGSTFKWEVPTWPFCVESEGISLMSKIDPFFQTSIVQLLPHLLPMPKSDAKTEVSRYGHDGLEQFEQTSCRGGLHVPAFVSLPAEEGQEVLHSRVH